MSEFTMTRPDVQNVRADNTLKMRCPKCMAGFHYFETWWVQGIDNPMQGYEPGYVDFGWVRSEGCKCEHGEELEDFVETIASEHMLDFEVNAYTHKGYSCETWGRRND